jgi:hypothetical protein
MLELPASRVQRHGVRGDGVRGIASPLSLEPEAITFSSFTFRRISQHRRELLDRVLRFDLR